MHVFPGNIQMSYGGETGAGWLCMEIARPGGGGEWRGGDGESSGEMPTRAESPVIAALSHSP